MHRSINETYVSLAADLTRAYASDGQLTAAEAAMYFRETLFRLSDFDFNANISELRDIHQDSKTTNNNYSTKFTPAVPITESVKPEYIVCLEDGSRHKMLKRYLRTTYGMTPDEYRKKWGLPNDYPMISPNYKEQKSQLAKARGFGKTPRK